VSIRALLVLVLFELLAAVGCQWGSLSDSAGSGQLVAWDQRRQPSATLPQSRRGGVGGGGGVAGSRSRGRRGPARDQWQRFRAQHVLEFEKDLLFQEHM
jgi:hypothetical protein